MKGNKSSYLRHRLTLQEMTQTADGYGGHSRSWADIADLWAEIIPLGVSGAKQGMGREILQAGQIQAEAAYRVSIRYYPGVHCGMRLMFNDRALAIRHIANPGERNEMLELTVQEGAAG